MRNKLLPSLGLLAALIVPLGALFAQVPPPVPALPDSERRTQYSISASTCACSVGFALFGDATDVDAWIEVWIGATRYLSTDGAHGWSLSSATGTLATIPRPITNAVLTFNAVQTGTVQIVGARRPRRASQFQENRGVAARDLNQVVTDLTAQNRETWDRTNDITGRTLRAPPGETFPTLPSAAARAGATLGFDGSGNPIPVIGFIGPQGPVGPTGPTGAAGGNAASTNYTSPGTGAVASNVNVRLAHELWAQDFGAVCDGSTDDHVAFQNMINAAKFPNNLAARFTGQCAIATTLTINASFSLVGTGQENAILRVSAGIDAIQVNSANYVNLRSFGIFGPGGSCGSAGGTFGIRFTSSQQAIVDSLLIDCVQNGIAFTASGAFIVYNTQIAGNPSPAGFIGVLLNSIGGAGSGAVDGTLYANFFNAAASAGIAVLCNSCAGLRMINNKVNGAWGNALAVSAINVQDGDLFVIGNSMEGFATGPAIDISRTDVVSFFGDFVISGNELSGTECLIVHTDATGAWILGATITGNVCNGANANPAWFINSVYGLTFSANQSWVSGAGVANASIGSLVNFGILGPNGCIAGPTNNGFKYTGAVACGASSNAGTNMTIPVAGAY